MCQYECGTELGDFDEKQNKYLELSGILHTRERCQSIKSQQTTSTRTRKIEPLTLEHMDVRLKRVEKMLFNAGT
jgi:hypothetical protein